MIHIRSAFLALQAMLLDSLFGTERGLEVSSELRGEISELITQLEAANPSETPNDVRNLRSPALSSYLCHVERTDLSTWLTHCASLMIERRPGAAVHWLGSAVPCMLGLSRGRT